MDMNRETSLHASDTLVVVDRSRRRRIILIAAVALAVVVIALAAYLMSREPDKSAAAAAQASQAAVPEITVIVPGRQQVARVISATGTIAARRDLPVGVAGEGGMVDRVPVEPGQWVGNGQVLAVIDRSVQRQEAAQLAASVNVAKADAALAQNELDRAQALVARGFISKAEIDQKRAARDAAAARVRVAQAQLAGAQARIGRLDIRAPAAGLVLERNVEAGQVVGGGSGALFRIAQGGQMEVQAKLGEQDLAAIHVGSPAVVSPVGTDVKIAGSVWQVSPVVDPASRQGMARVAVPYQKLLRPGAFAQVSLTSGTADVPLLPQSAVFSDEKGNYVYVVDKDNRVQRRGITVGDVDERGVTIASGLSGNERVVVSAGAFLNPDDKINPVRQAAAR
jgi:RND family efflux transporter MFP subunit